MLKIPAVLILLFLSTAALHSQLVGSSETPLFSFKTKGGKTAVLCAGPESSYLVYRFGTNKNIELEFPEVLDGTSWKKFTYSFYFRGGGVQNDGEDLNYITFQNNGYEYKIFSEYYAIGEKTATGIIITDSNNKETTIKATGSSVKGSLIDFRDNDKINTEH